MTRPASRPPLALVRPQRDVAFVIRVSTDMQARNPEGSLKNQLQRLRQHVQYRTEVVGEDWREVAIYELKGVSGKNSARSKEFEQLYADIRAGHVNTVVCTSLERVCRSLKDFLTLFEFFVEHGVEFVCLKQNYDTTSPQGKLFVTILMALAEFEREQTAERTRDAALARAERGLWNGGRILGYDLDPAQRGHLFPNPDEAAVVRFAFDAYLRLGSIGDVAEAMSARGLRTKAYTSRREIEHESRPFGYTTLQHILKNVAYIGRKRLITGEEVEAVWPAIVDPDVFERVQALLKVNRRANRNQAAPVRHVHVLAGLLKCGRCDGMMQGRSGTGRGGKTYFYYACTNADCHLRAVAPEVEDAVIQRIGELAGIPDTVEALTDKANRQLLRARPEIEARLAALRRSLKSSTGASTTLAKALVRASGDGTAAINDELGRSAQRRRELEDAIVEAEGQLASLESARASADAVVAGLANFKRVFAHLLPYEQRELVRLVVKEARLGDRALVLELYGDALGNFEGKKKANPCSGFAAAPIWLPDLDSNQEHRG